MVHSGFALQQWTIGIVTGLKKAVKEILPSEQPE
jgi:hypothetical protein